MTAWFALIAAALVFTGALIIGVNGPPRALRRSEPEGPTVTGLDEERARFAIRWLDQYAWIGVGLVILGLAAGALALLTSGDPLPRPAADAPVALIYVGLHGLMLVALSLLVLRFKVRIGARGAELAERISRVQGNFLEYVPMALILLWMVEAGGAPAAAVHALGATLLLARLLHAWGLGRTAAPNYPRMIGALMTFLVLAMLGFTGLWLALAPTA